MNRFGNEATWCGEVMEMNAKSSVIENIEGSRDGISESKADGDRFSVWFDGRRYVTAVMSTPGVK